MRLRGETVIVVTRSIVGRDAMGEAVYEHTPSEVENVLVQTGQTNDLTDARRQDGYTVSYTLAFPKTFTMAADELALAHVAIPSRGGSFSDKSTWLKVIGNPDVTDPCPTRWNRRVMVGGANG